MLIIKIIYPLFINNFRKNPYFYIYKNLPMTKIYILVLFSFAHQVIFAQKASFVENERSIAISNNLLYEKLYSSWKILDSSSHEIPFEVWHSKVQSGDYILAEHPYNSKKTQSKTDTPIKQLILLDENIKEKRSSFRKDQILRYGLNIRGTMPNFVVKDLNNVTYTNESIYGNAFVIYIGCYTTCTEGLWELAEADKLCREFSEKGVKFVAINYKDFHSNLKAIASKNNLKIPLANYSTSIRDIFEPLGDIPMRIVIDKYGNVVHKSNGYAYIDDGDESLYTLAIRRVLEKCIAPSIDTQ